MHKCFVATQSEGKPVLGVYDHGKGKKKSYEDMKVETGVKFSDGWLRDFKFCHGIHTLHVAGEKN